MGTQQYITLKVPVNADILGLEEKLDDIRELVIRGFEMLRTRMGDVEEMVYNTKEELRADLDAATNELADRFDTLTSDLEEALANVETGEDAQAAVRDILDSFSDVPAKLRSIGASKDDIVPADTLPGADAGTDTGAVVDSGSVEPVNEVDLGGEQTGTPADASEGTGDVSIESPTDETATAGGDAGSTPQDRLNP